MRRSLGEGHVPGNHCPEHLVAKVGGHIAHHLVGQFMRESYIVKSMPPMRRFGFRLCCTELIVWIRRLKPSIAKYSHCIGMMMKSDATRQLRERSPNDGGLSMKI